jgi:integrase
VPNAKLRTREYLTEAEVVSLTEAAKGNRYGHRDATMILVAYRHGLRASELVDLRWDQSDFDRDGIAGWICIAGRYAGAKRTGNRPATTAKSAAVIQSCHSKAIVLDMLFRPAKHASLSAV